MVVNMKNKRFFSRKGVKNVAVVLCVFSVFFICGCNKRTKQQEITTVTLWSGNSHSKYVKADFFNAYNGKQGKKDGIFIDYYVKDGELAESLVKEAIAAGNAPDFMGVYSEEIIKNGDALAIENLPGGLGFLESFEDSEIKVQTDGKTYALKNGLCTQGLIYNKDLFKKAGIVNQYGEPVPPATYDELRDYAKRLTDSDKNQYGIVVPMAWSGWFNSDILFPSSSSCGFCGYNPQTGRYDYTAVKKIAGYFVDMKNDGSIMPGENLLNNDQARSLFADGNIGMKMAFSFDAGVLNDQFAAKCDWDVAKYPTLDATVRYPARMTSGVTGLMSSQSLENVGGFKMLKVFKMLISDDTILHDYKEGISIPYNPEVMENSPLGDDEKPGWKAFCNLVYDSVEYKQKYHQIDDITSASLRDIFINEIWTGKRDLNEAFDSYESAVNIAIEANAKQNGNQ